jgi:hypothetical protein
VLAGFSLASSGAFVAAEIGEFSFHRWLAPIKIIVHLPNKKTTTHQRLPFSSHDLRVHTTVAVSLVHQRPRFREFIDVMQDHRDDPVLASLLPRPDEAVTRQWRVTGLQTVYVQGRLIILPASQEVVVVVGRLAVN